MDTPQKADLQYSDIYCQEKYKTLLEFNYLNKNMKVF